MVEHVVELEADVVAIGALRRHEADDDVIVAEPSPVVEGDVRAHVRLLDHVLAIHGLEAAAARQIVAHDLGDVEVGSTGRRERHDGDGDGIVLPAGHLDHEFREAALSEPQANHEEQNGKGFIHRV